MLDTFYGVWNKQNGHVDVSMTLRGAKLFASKNGYIIVSRREGKYTRKLAKKLNGKWEEL